MPVVNKEQKMNPIPCVFTGPWAIYKDTFSEAVRSQLLMLNETLGADLYWVKSEPALSAEAIAKIDMARMVEDIEAIRRVSGHDKILTIGPSAAGFPAAEYAKVYPEHSLGVMLIGTPLCLMSELGGRGSQFFHHSFNPVNAPFGEDKTKQQHWESDLNNRAAFFQRTYQPALNAAEELTQAEYVPTPIEDLDDAYAAELAQVQRRLYWQPEEKDQAENVTAMSERWRLFNIPFRLHFFSNIAGPQYDGSALLSIKNTPVLCVNGLFDAICPPDILFSLETSHPDHFYSPENPSGNFILAYVPKAAHLPQEENREAFDALCLDYLSRIRRPAAEAEEGLAVPASGVSGGAAVPLGPS